MTSGYQANASHAMGADLTYESLGGNTYKVRFSFYRDCVGIPAPANVYISIRSVSCNRNLGVTANPIPGTGQQVTYLCPTATSTCNGGTFTGIQEWVYEGIVTLPMQCTDWQFSYSLCCRNAAITTISNPGSNTFYVYASLNNVASTNNSSPVFSNKPVPFACLGQQLCFNHGAVDVDGDSLVYSLVNPKQTATSNVAYIAPYNAINPLNSSPALQFNTATGDICFTPQQLQVTVMAVLVKEYRNGVLIGSVVRDIQVTVLNCNNSLPSLTGINGTNDFDVTVCANDPLCFNVFSNDPDAGQQLSVFYNNAIPAATFNASGTPHPTGTFCWTPTQADISNNPYCFTLRVGDDACPYIGSQTYSYCITVAGIKVDLGPDQFIACSDIATVTASVSGGNAPYTYLWSNGFTGPTQTVPVGTYVVTVSDGTCTSTDTVQIISAFEPTADFIWSGACLHSTVAFTDQSILSGSIQNWSWNFGDGSSSSQQNPVHSYASAGAFNVSLVVQNIYGCIDTIIQPVTILPLPIPAFTVDTACVGSGINFINTSTPQGSGYTWIFSNGTTSSSLNPVLVVGASGTYSATLIVEDTLGCSDTLNKSFVVHAQPVAAFSHSGTNCLNGGILFTDNSTGNPVSWSWNFGDGGLSTSQNPTHSFASSGTYNVSLVVGNAFGCTDTIIQPVFINPPPFINASANVAVCLGSSVNLSATGGISYVWNPGSSNGNPVSVSPSSTTTYIVIGTDANGCTGTDSVTVTVHSLPVATITPNQTICSGQSVSFTAGGGVSYYWNPSGSTTSSITVTPNSSTTYAVDVVDGNGCQATAFVNVTVHANPVISLQPAVFICSGVSATLNPGTGVSWIWSTGDTTQTISVGTQGSYSVTVTNQYGCTANATTQVTVGGQVVSNNNAISICQGQIATLNAGYAGSTYQWSNGSTAQTISAINSGVYTVTITDASGCSGTVMHTVNVHPLPVPNFTPYDVCINTAVQFTDISNVNGDSIASWSWNLGDGNVSYQQNPLHNYLTSGVFPIALTITTSAGCVASLSDTVNVYPLPQSSFSFVNGCEGNAISFHDNSTTGMGNINYWSWSFGDGSYSSSQHPSHLYAAPGTYNVLLTVGTAGGCLDSIHKQVIVFPSPLLAFTTSTPSNCAGALVSFNNLSTTTNGAINSWNWNFGNGITSAAANPSSIYYNAGNYAISLIATTSHGCTDTVIQSIVMNPLPIVDAGLNASLCKGSSITLTATGGSSYVWSPGGNTSSTITVAPILNTTYFVVATNSFGCTARDSVRITLLNLPIPNAGADKSVCAGGSVNLNATGGGTYSWSPGNLTGANVSVTPNSTTNYFVTVTSINGCRATDTVNVLVNPLPTASAGPDQVICEGTTTLLIASGGATYLWQHNGATSAAVYVNPAINTSYIVTVTSAAGCSKKDTMNVSLNPTPVVNLNNAFFCTGYSTVLDAGNPGMSYEWIPTTETTQSIVASTPGIYQVVVTNSYGCQGTGASTVIEGGNGLVSNPINVMACQGTITVLDAANIGSTYLWSTGATSQTINVINTGSYSVTVTDIGGCSATFTNNVIVNPLPVVNFVNSPSCLGNPTTLVDQTSLASGNILSWNWTLPNGGISNTQNPNYIFPNAGTFPVTLVVTSGLGCVDSISKNVTISPLPIASFNATTVCLGATTLFADNSTISSGLINIWNWNFGDGHVANGNPASHTYSTPGNYVATLVVASAIGCVDTVIASVNVNPMPLARFNAPEVCDGDSMSFYNTTVINNGSISDIAWTFGDGATSTDVNPKHKYLYPGQYIVTLTVGSDQSCQNTFTDTVTVNNRPVAAILSASTCNGTAANFIDNSTIGNGSITNWYWSFGDGTGSNSQHSSHVYSNSGVYAISLVATSDKGCSDTSFASSSIMNLPVAAFAISSSCFGNAMNFNDASTIASGSISMWHWDFGDGAVSSSANPTHTYAAIGTYPVTLVVTSNSGCSDTITQSINVYPVPVANFAASNVCLNNQTEFYDQSQIVGGSAFTFLWTLGDGSIATSGTPVHTYAAAGSYNVTLVVSTPFGCLNTVTKPVAVYDLPIASFVSGDVCLNSTSLFMDASSIGGGTITGWQWTLGDGNTSSAQNPSHFYGTPGTYPVTIEVTSNFGCKVTALDSVQIFAPPTPMPTSGTDCVNNSISFADTASGPENIIVTYDWDFGGGNASALANPSFVFTTSGTHTVSLTTTNASGCSATRTVVVAVSPLPVAGFLPSDPCANSATIFTNTSTISSGSISGYQWDFGDGSGISTITNPSYAYSQAGTYNVTLVAYSAAGCADTIVHTVIVHPLPTANFLQVSAAGCGPLVVQFTDSSFITTGNVTAWFWDFGDGTSSVVQNPSHTYLTSGTYSVTLTVTSDFGCQNSTTLSNVVTVYPGPTAEFQPDPSTQSILHPEFNFINQSTGALIYHWTFGDGGSSIQFEPNHVYADTGNYMVTLWVVNSYGCKDTVKHPVRVEPEFHWWIPNAFSPNEDGVNDGFNVTGISIVDVKLSIFNRWGDQIFYSEGRNNRDWDGSVVGMPNKAQEGVYVYQVIVKDVWGYSHEKVGQVYLVR